MALIELEAGTEARVQPLNDNFSYLETQITNVGNTVSSQASQISTLSTSVGTLTSSVESLGTNKANKNGDNITEDFATALVTSYGSKFNPKADYANAVSKTNGTTYTATSNGYVYIYGGGWCVNNTQAPRITINGVTYYVGNFLGQYDNNGMTAASGAVFPISVGDTYKSDQATSLYFIPLK